MIIERTQDIRDTGAVHHISLRFFTPEMASRHNFNFWKSGEESDPNKKYAVLIAVGDSGLILKGALVDVDHQKYQKDEEYKLQVDSEIRLMSEAKKFSIGQ